MTSEAIDFTPAEVAELAPADAVSSLLRKAHQANASDLFFLSEPGFVRVAMRRLGSIEQMLYLSDAQGRPIINYVRAMCGIDIGDNRHASDGRWSFRAEPEGENDDVPLSLSVRANSLPTEHGVDLTLRLLDDEAQMLSIDELGLLEPELALLRAMLESPHGLILVTGPTGAGKTTTLYACLQRLNDGTRKINTLEDPIEYSIRGISQSQVAPKADLDFPHLLRNVLRQAPDVIMIGEVRDEETAKTAVRAANSGHLVFATLHARVAAQAIESMMAHGVNPYFLANSLRGVVTQRLLRRLSPESRVPYDISSAEGMFKDVQHLLQDGQGHHIYGPNAADESSKGGYIGLTGTFEVLWVDSDMRRLISEGAPSGELEEHAIANGFIDFRQGTLLRIARGITSVEEMARVVQVD